MSARAGNAGDRIAPDTLSLSTGWAEEEADDVDEEDSVFLMRAYEGVAGATTWMRRAVNERGAVGAGAGFTPGLGIRDTGTGRAILLGGRAKAGCDDCTELRWNPLGASA